MKSFYDIIGVKKSASPDEIKRAYRERAAKIHPDKGGNHAEMAELSRAYTCLKDPVARLTYDETGEEPKINGVEQAAKDLLVQKFSEMLTKGIDADVLGRVRQVIHAERSQLQQQKQQAEQAIEKCRRRRDEITVKQGTNLWHALIDESVKGLTAAVKNCEMQVQIRDRALEMLAEYSEIEKEQPVQYVSTFQTTGFFVEFR